jgi:hypothetical protein
MLAFAPLSAGKAAALRGSARTLCHDYLGTLLSEFSSKKFIILWTLYINPKLSLFKKETSC